MLSREIHNNEIVMYLSLKVNSAGWRGGQSAKQQALDYTGHIAATIAPIGVGASSGNLRVYTRNHSSRRDLGTTVVEIDRILKPYRLV